MFDNAENDGSEFLNTPLHSGSGKKLIILF